MKVKRTAVRLGWSYRPQGMNRPSASLGRKILKWLRRMEKNFSGKPYEVVCTTWTAEKTLAALEKAFPVVVVYPVQIGAFGIHWREVRGLLLLEPVRFLWFPRTENRSCSFVNPRKLDGALHVLNLR